MYIFINNSIKANDTPTIYANDRGFLLGDGLFETIKYEGGRFQFLQQHLNRIGKSMLDFFFEKPSNFNDIPDICNELITKNNLKNSVASIRITITRGASERGISVIKGTKPTILITAQKYSPKKNFSPSALITDVIKNEHSFAIKHKTTQYLDHIFARAQAEQRGFNEAILINSKKNITESTIANLFLVIGGQIVTPKISDGILPGIIRKFVIQCCRNANLSIQERSISIDEASSATEIFQTNSLVGIQSLSKIDDHILQIEDNASHTTLIKQLYAKNLSTY